MQKDDITLIKSLGKGSFGEVFLSTKKGRKQYFATKKIERKLADSPNLKKYFQNEIDILTKLNHPNIVKLEEVKKTKDHYYLVMEYINGGGLSNCLKKYMKQHGKAFPEEIVQYLMRQIIEALYYLHSRKIIHRDIKLDNIMVNFDSDYDKGIMNMMKAKIKIIDFGFATHLEKTNLTFSAVGSPINMDPIILNKFSKRRGPNLGYDTKADIWSIGTVCYELLIGKPVFSASTMNDLVHKVENGNYELPKTLSQEVVSFLNGMLLYDSNSRLSAEQLLKHPFLTKNVNDFKRLDAIKITKKENNKNIQKNNSIWGIYDNGEHFEKIKGEANLPDAPIPEEEYQKKRSSLEKRKSTKSRHRHSDKNNLFYKDNKEVNNFKAYNVNNEHKNNNNKNQNNNEEEKYLHRAKTYKNLAYAKTSLYNQNIYPQLNAPMNIPQQNMTGYPVYAVPMNYNYQLMYPDNLQKPATNYPGNTQKPYSAKNVANYYGQYPNTERHDDGCSIQ